MFVSPRSFRDHYQQLVASGAIEARSCAGEARVETLPRWKRISSAYKPAGKAGLLGRLFADGNAAAARALHLWRGRPRQDHADGPVLRRQRRSRASAARIFTNSWPTFTSASTRFRQKIASAARSPDDDPIQLPRTRSSRKRGCCASTNSTSPTSPTR